VDRQKEGIDYVETQKDYEKVPWNGPGGEKAHRCHIKRGKRNFAQKLEDPKPKDHFRFSTQVHSPKSGSSERNKSNRGKTWGGEPSSDRGVGGEKRIGEGEEEREF